MFRYSVCKISKELFPEINDKKHSWHSLRKFFKKHSEELLKASMDDRFSKYQDAQQFMQEVYRVDGSGDIVAIYDWLRKSWINIKFL